jgi:transcriptional regulator with XRE-family HTH domain
MCYRGGMTVAAILRSARRRAGLTQRQLAEIAGVPQPTVARIESGVVSPRADTLARLLAAAGRELSDEPRIGHGVDRTAMRDRLRLTPAERIGLAVQEARAFAGMRFDR